MLSALRRSRASEQGAAKAPDPGGWADDDRGAAAEASADEPPPTTTTMAAAAERALPGGPPASPKIPPSSPIRVPAAVAMAQQTLFGELKVRQRGWGHKRQRSGRPATTPRS